MIILCLHYILHLPLQTCTPCDPYFCWWHHHFRRLTALSSRDFSLIYPLLTHSISWQILLIFIHPQFSLPTTIILICLDGLLKVSQFALLPADFSPLNSILYLTARLSFLRHFNFCYSFTCVIRGMAMNSYKFQFLLCKIIIIITQNSVIIF